VYGKIFDSIYNGTLYGQWEALVTMQQFIVLADADGVVDMTPMAISARTSIPREIIDKGIDILGAPDKYTRTPGGDGRRIELIDEHRPWGWILVNYEHYKSLRDADTVRAQTRARVRKHRRKKLGLIDVEMVCAYCGDDAIGGDHIKPRCDGGTDAPENIVPCCDRCNRNKASQDVFAFINNPQNHWVNVDLALSHPHLKRLVTTRNDSKPHIDIQIDIKKSVHFDAFWAVYPNKKNKKKALALWVRNKLDIHADAIMANLTARTDWKDIQFTPLPTTYLAGERWNDELEAAAVTTGDEAVKLGLTQNTNESDKHFEKRVCNALVMGQYGGA